MTLFLTPFLFANITKRPGRAVSTTPHRNCCSTTRGGSIGTARYGAHSSIFDEVQTLWIDKGVRYQMFHSLALLCTSLVIASHIKTAKTAILEGWCFLAGTILFSGSLYFMGISSTDVGYITPAGGVLFLLGWIFLALSGPTKK